MKLWPDAQMPIVPHELLHNVLNHARRGESSVARPI